jgi:hypothetical protein
MFGEISEYGVFSFECYTQVEFLEYVGNSVNFFACEGKGDLFFSLFLGCLLL